MHRRSLPMPRTNAALAALLLASGCNAYSTFRLTGYAQEGFSNKADILFVIDNSPSMVDEADSLAVNFDTFIEQFADKDPPSGSPTLGDDVLRYVDYVSDRTGNVNYQMGITTTDAFTTSGLLLGSPQYLTRNDDNVPRKFNSNLLCEAACVTDEPSIEVTCSGGSRPGPGNCADSVQGSAEEPIEAVYAAMCRAAENPPEACFLPWFWDPSSNTWKTRGGSVDTGETDVPDGLEQADYIEREDADTNGGWMRDGSVVIPVIITDEGDQSRRIAGRSGDPAPYPQLFQEFGHRMSWAVIGPDTANIATDANVCNTAGAAGWGIQRLARMVTDTNGVYLPIAEESGGSCAVTDFGAALTEIGNLLRGLADTFPLATLPVEGSIVVKVNGKLVREADCRDDDDLGTVVCDDGWVYDAASNAVILKGDAVPEFNADVRVWYLPASGVPRNLPF